MMKCGSETFYGAAQLTSVNPTNCTSVLYDRLQAIEDQERLGSVR